jgi:hypothetical protein
MITSRQTIPMLRLELSKVFMNERNYLHNIPKQATDTKLITTATFEFFSTVTTESLIC